VKEGQKNCCKLYLTKVKWQLAAKCDSEFWTELRSEGEDLLVTKNGNTN
jgi:hypothetical protein